VSVELEEVVLDQVEIVYEVLLELRIQEEEAVAAAILQVAVVPAATELLLLVTLTRLKLQPLLQEVQLI
jgi:hypothetical protein